MVSFYPAGPEPCIVVEPNRSASWSANKRLLGLLGLWFLVLGTVALSLGLWPIIPFLGLELIALAAGLHYVCCKLRQRHVLRLGGETLLVQKGNDRPQFSWELPRAATSLSVATPPHPWDPLIIHLCCRTELIALGDFLNKEESRDLLRLLREQGLPVRNHSSLGHLAL